MAVSGSCRKCGGFDFGIWTSSSTGAVRRYCRPCRRVRAVTYISNRTRNGGSHTWAEWLKKLAKYDRCPRCRLCWADIPPRPDRRYRYVWTKDHIVPLNKGGTDDISTATSGHSATGAIRRSAMDAEAG